MKGSVLDGRPVVKCTDVVLNRVYIEPDHKDKRQMCAKKPILVISNWVCQVREVYES